MKDMINFNEPSLTISIVYWFFGRRLLTT